MSYCLGAYLAGHYKIKTEFRQPTGTNTAGRYPECWFIGVFNKWLIIVKIFDHDRKGSLPRSLPLALLGADWNWIRLQELPDGPGLSSFPITVLTSLWQIPALCLSKVR